MEDVEGAAVSDSNGGREILPPLIADIVTPAKPNKDYTVYEGPITPSRKNTGRVEEFIL